MTSTRGFDAPFAPQRNRDVTGAFIDRRSLRINERSCERVSVLAISIQSCSTSSRVDRVRDVVNFRSKRFASGARNIVFCIRPFVEGGSPAFKTAGVFETTAPIIIAIAMAYVLWRVFMKKYCKVRLGIRNVPVSLYHLKFSIQKGYVGLPSLFRLDHFIRLYFLTSRFSFRISF